MFSIPYTTAINVQDTERVLTMQGRSRRCRSLPATFGIQGEESKHPVFSDEEQPPDARADIRAPNAPALVTMNPDANQRSTKSLHEEVWKVQQSSRTLHSFVLQHGLVGAQARVQVLRSSIECGFRSLENGNLARRRKP